jgi:hypothetical protein
MEDEVQERIVRRKGKRNKKMELKDGEDEGGLKESEELKEESEKGRSGRRKIT